ncbi:hypothetical protein [Photobacterium leiognathi]|uniref:hypothetical protein n=1 Tax=Photobacterium leiognathi TaxID=553611 RepID=UPI0027342DF5|nr:hypothetical protein [Photobacterium leiognathi]
MRDVVPKELLSELAKAKYLKGQNHIIMIFSIFIFTLCYSKFPLFHDYYLLRLFFGILAAVATFCCSALFINCWLVKIRTYNVLMRLQPSRIDVKKLLKSGFLFSSEQRAAFEKYLKLLNS